MILPPLYHWSPAARFESIKTNGLQPGSESTISSGVLTYICLSPDPATGWSLSGAMDWYSSEIDQWDLWMVHLADTDSVHVRPEFGAKIQEVKVLGAIPPDRLWHCGRRHDMGLIAK